MSEDDFPSIDGGQLQEAMNQLNPAKFPDLNALLAAITYLEWREEYTYSVEHNFDGEAPIGIDSNTADVIADTVKLFAIDLPEDGDYPDLQAHVMDLKEFVLQDIQVPQHSHTVYEEEAKKARTVLRTALYYLREVGLEDLYNWTGNDYPFSEDYRAYGLTGVPYYSCQAILTPDSATNLSEIMVLLGYAIFREVLEEVRIMQKHSVRFGLVGI